MALGTPKEAPATQQSVDIWGNALKSVDEMMPRNHPLAAEYAKKSAEAWTVLKRMSMTLTMPSGADLFVTVGDQLAKLYDEMKGIRLATVQDRIKAAMGIPSTLTIDAALEPRMQAIERVLPPKYLPLMKKLRQIAKDISANPKDVHDGEARSALFFGKGYGKDNAGEPNLDTQQAYLKIAREISALGTINPDFAALGTMLEVGLKQLESVNPVLAATYQKVDAFLNNRNKLDARPLKILGFMAGSLIAGLGLTQNAVQLFKGDPVTVSPITPVWGVLAVFSAHPEWLRGATKRQLAQLADLGKPPVIKAVQSLPRGDEGGKVYSDFASLNRGGKTRGLIHTTVKTQNQGDMTEAQVGALFQPTSVLGKAFLKLDAGKRRTVLGTLAGLRTEQLQVLEELSKKS